ncbi:MAG TPA: AAA family ATPase [Acidimicrobiales bacterium]|nr:AAA family ATPase [Acidimicrobiales bacterium]
MSPKEPTAIKRGEGHSAGNRPETFVGRQLELDELKAGLADSLIGNGGLFLLEGEPGVGKTRLADEFAVHAQGEGALVLWGRCWEGGGAPSYWPWVQVMRSYLRFGDPQSFIEELGVCAGYLAQIVPELRDAIAGLPSTPSLEPEHLRFALFDAMSTFLCGAAGRQPLVLVLDDLHAADRPSLRFLQFLALNLRHSSLLVVAGYRGVEAKLDPGVQPLFGELARHGHLVPLGGLNYDDIAALVAQAGPTVPEPATVEAIHQVTDGNPFFVHEVIRMLRTEGRLNRPLSSGEALRVPEGVRDAIGLRLARLSPEANHVLAVASVLGRDFDAHVVERTAGLTTDEVWAALDEAVDAQLIVEALRAVRRYSFRHALVRDTLYEALPAGRRAALHRDVGEALEELCGGNVDARVPELAHHFFQAAAVGAAGKALEFSARAGDQAAEMLGYEEASGHYGRALQAIAVAGAIDNRRRCELLLCLAESQWRAGDSAAARSGFLEVAGMARVLRTPEMLARAAVGYARGLGGFLHVVRADHTIISLLEEALGGLEARDSTLRARLLSRLAVELYYTHQIERRVALSGEAIEMARRLEDPGSLLVALYSRHWAACGPDTLDERLANATEMVRLAGEVGDREMAILGHHVRLNCLLERCDVGPVDREIEEMAALADELRQPFYRWRTTCLRAMRAILEARFDEAERLANEAFEIGGGIDHEIARLVHDGAQMFALRFGQGRLAELEGDVLHLTRRYPWIQPWRLPLLYSELGREREAGEELERQAVRDFADFPMDGLWITRVAALAHACALVGDATRAAQLYKLLLPYGDRNVSTIADQSYGPVATRLGMLSAVMEHWDEAEAHFCAGLEHCRAQRSPTFTALNLSEHARMLLARARRGDLEEARNLLAEAEVICKEHGIRAVLERVVRERARAGDGPAKDRMLFRREGEYWSVHFRGDVIRMKGSRGLGYLAQLLANPGTEIHVLDLTAARGTSSPRSYAMTAAEAARAGIRVSSLEGIEALDEQAKASYRRRLAELEEDLEEARAFNDPQREALIDEEMEALTRELTAAVGLGGANRKWGSPSERARVNVTRSIRSSIAAIGESSPALGGHLRATVRTGTFCAYLPGADGPGAWTM